MSTKPRKREEILRDLERLRRECPPNLYAYQSARFIDELKRLPQTRRRAIT